MVGRYIEISVFSFLVKIMNVLLLYAYYFSVFPETFFGIVLIDVITLRNSFSEG